MSPRPTGSSQSVVARESDEPPSDPQPRAAPMIDLAIRNLSLAYGPLA